MSARPAPRPRAAPRSRSAAPKYKYPGAGRKVGSTLGSMVGNLVAPGVGGFVGGTLGGLAGDGAQALVKRITGFGDYTVKKNSILYNQDAVPEFSDSNVMCTMISHREFISDVKSSINFANTEYRINPAISTSFPWLSAIADNYEEYVIQGMVFEYKTTSATAIGSTNTALGTVILATRYNSLSAEFMAKQQMEATQFSQSSVPSQSVLHAIECDPAQTPSNGRLYMFNPNDINGDRRLYDLGRFNIATVGMQEANVTIGELWVSYKICLLKPKLNSVEDVADGYALNAYTGTITSSTPVSTIPCVPFSTNSVFTSQNYSLGSPYNTWTIDPSFVGVLCCILSYKCSANPSGGLTMPQIVPFNTKCHLVNNKYLGSLFTDPVLGRLPPDTLGEACSISFISVDGGFDVDTGLSAQVLINYAEFSPTTIISEASLQFIAIPGQYNGFAFRNP